MAYISETDSRLSEDSARLEQCSCMTWAPNTQTMLFLEGNREGSGQEQFRMLRSRIYQSRERGPLKSILITSALPGEGRSFTAANLALALACQERCRVLLVDADLRNPSLHQSLGTLSAPGLSDYLSGEEDEFGILQRGQAANLFFVASGRPVSGQSEVVSNGRLKLLLDRLGPLFEWIIIDSPAAMPVLDSGLIANYCDGVLMVVRSESTPFDVVRKARERFRDEHLLGVVLNGIPDQKHLSNGYYPDGSQISKSKADAKSSTADSSKGLTDKRAQASTDEKFILPSRWPRLLRWARR
ncbi:MAG TPA: CpsD/CapB family tyrosine-protein kinase [Candidatus Sulfotelmatobacter sp.]|nr:CpsD/CapB family tyrosine-protein kinase [Candidatus Sulfotelmatobacter sp.]